MYNLISNLNVKDKIATAITERDFTKIADQLDHSMGVTMTYSK